MSQEEAEIEVQEWLRVSDRLGIAPEAVVFPRNVVGHLQVFRERGFICYRGKMTRPRVYQYGLIGKLLKHIDHVCAFSIPHPYPLDGREPMGLVNLPASMEFFDFNRKIELILDSLSLHKVRINRMVKAVKEAAEKKRIVHVSAHPCEFQTRKDFEKLRYLLGHVADEISRGRLRSISMSDLARTVIRHQLYTSINIDTGEDRSGEMRGMTV